MPRGRREVSKMTLIFTHFEVGISVAGISTNLQLQRFGNYMYLMFTIIIITLFMYQIDQVICRLTRQIFVFS